MTVYNELNKIAYIGSSEQTLYPIPFEYISTDDIKVSVYTSNNEFVEDWTYSIQYVIEGGNVKVLSGYNIDNTKKLLILRSVDLIQDNKYREGGDFPAKSTETSFDKLTMITQQLQETLDRCVKVEVLDNQTPEELLQTVYDKLDSATEIAGDAISAANQAQTAADNATAAVNSAEQTLANVTAYVDSAKVEIDNTKNTAINTINSTVAQAKSDINTAVSNAESNISTIVSDAEGSITNIAVTEANKAIANAAQEATDMAKANLNSYVDGTVKPSLQTYVDQAQENANSAATSMEQAALSATSASNYASSASAAAENAANSAGLAANSATEASNSEEKAAEYLQQISNRITVVEGSIGDIGFAPLGIDEAQNKRRYLNGQVISQSQFVSFTNKIKSAIELYPSLATTETNWQAEVTNSKLGQCGKFVIDDTSGTIRLPKVVNINGLQDLSLLGGIKAESLPNIKAGDPSNQNTLSSPGNAATGQYGAAKILGNADDVSRFQIGGLAGILKRAVFDASLSSSTYQDNAPVQQEAIQYPYFIQVATGVEESVDVTREIELNNPFSLLDYKWSEYELNNASWLLSNGAFHSGATYVAVYELLLKIKNGTETKDGVSVKLLTEAYTDTDFVINTADTTFRLPIKVKLASGNAVVGNGKALGFTDGTNNYGLKQNSTGGYGFADAREAFGQNVGVTITGNTLPPADRTLGVTTDPTKSGIETSSSGLKLYFYVGETIQDANLINAGQMSTLISQLRECHVVIGTYVNGTSGYRIWSDGYCEQWGNIPFTSTGGWASGTITFLKPFKDTNYYINGRGNWSDRQSCDFGLNSKTTTNFNVTVAINTLTSENGAWIACGYLAEGEY